MNNDDKKLYDNTVNCKEKIEKIASKVLKSEGSYSVIDENKKVIGSLLLASSISSNKFNIIPKA